MPCISVIIPARNDPRRLARCLEALAGSSFEDYEIIVADDASSDDTPRIAETMGARVVRLPKRGGAAAARNAGAEIARGSIFLFVDSDVCVHHDALAVAAASFDDPGVHAVFGSYDLEPGEPNLLSQYKNLAHRFYHQNSDRDVGTFWTGCGAIRRDVFDAFKFDAAQFTRPSIEDIELGARLTRAGKRVVVNPNLQAKHLKRWTLPGIVRSDLLDRAIPWTRVMLCQQQLSNDLNLSAGQRIAAALALLSAGIFMFACWFRPWLALLPLVVFGLIALADKFTARRSAALAPRIAAVTAVFMVASATVWYARWLALAALLPLAGVVLINARFYGFFIRHRGWLFTVAVALPMQVLYYLYSIAGLAAGTLLHWRDVISQRLDHAGARMRLYVALTLALYLASWTLVVVRAHVKQTTIDFAVSDAIGYYAYLPSLVIDRDLQFENQLQAQRQTDAEYVESLRRNRWPIGVALSVMPAFLAAHGTSLFLYHWTGIAAVEPHGYSLLYFIFCVAWAMSIGMLGLILVDRLIVERLHVPGRMAAAAVLTTWLGTNYMWYFTREPLVAHMAGASWVIFCIYLIHRLERNALEGRLAWWHLPLLAFTASMALTCRLTNAFMLPLFVYLGGVLIRQRLLGRALRLAPMILLAMAPLVLQVIIMKLVLGQTVHDDMQQLGYKERERFYWTDPALFRTLFSSRHGLFFGTPALLLAAWGWIWHLVRRGGWRDPLLACFAVAALSLWYVNSAWYAWWFGSSVGNRAFVELAGFYAIGFALAFIWMSRLQRGTRRVVLGSLAFAFLVNYGMMAVKLFDIVRENQSLIPWEDRVFIGRWERI